MKGLLLLIPLFAPICMCADDIDSSYVVYADEGAAKWDQGYPIGNGRLGLLSLGTYPKDTFYLNEHSIWAKQDVDYRESGPETMAEIRRLATAGDYKAAESFFTKELLKPDWRPGSYEYAGHAHIEHIGMGEAQTIQNTLDLRTGLSQSVATFKDGTLTREAIALRERDLIAVRISTTRPEGLHFQLSLEHPRDPSVARGNQLILSGQAASGGTTFDSILRVLPNGGELKLAGKHTLEVKGGEEAIVLFTAVTDYNIENPQQPLTNWQARAVTTLHEASKVNWSTLLAEGQSEMRTYMERFSIDLGETTTDIAHLPTAERIQLYKDGGIDPDYEELLFNFGRYCVVASNVTSGLPNNLQGIWSEGIVAPWSGDYHLNINLQMNYWPVEATGLSEFHQPMFDLIHGLQPAGKKFAESLGYEGFCSGHAVNAWMNTWFSGGQALWGASLMNGAWVTAHLMEHYRYTGDETFLEDQAWPAIQENARFVLSWLQKDSATGEWLTGPGTSPENQFIYKAGGEEITAAVSIGTTHDLMLAWESLADFIEAATALNKDNDLVQRAKAVLPELGEGKIAEDGRLQEWREPFGESRPGHRHVSHAYGFFPSRQYNIIEDTEMVDAIKKSLDFRLANGGGRTGWSRAWLINIEACLLRSESAYSNIRTMLSKLINPNLFDMHPPFQIDGNFGYTSAVVNMLLQSQIQLESGERVIWLLPALPKAWPQGEVHGLKTRGGATVNLKWSPDIITADISSDRSGPFMIRYDELSVSLPKTATRVTIQIQDGKKPSITIE